MSAACARRLAGAGLAASLALGCQGWAGPSEPPCVEDRAAAVALPLSSWQEGQLHRAAGRCERWYALEVGRPGELQVDVYSGESRAGERRPGASVPLPGPDFDVRLENEGGDMLWGDAATGVSPRMLRRVVGPGRYYLRVSSHGPDGSALAYELYAALGALPTTGSLPVRTPAEPRRRAQAAPRPARTPAPAPPPGGAEFWLGAEILGVETTGAGSGAIWIDAGARDDLRVGLRGELLGAAGPIARLELVQVERARSLARVLDGAAATLGAGRRVRVRVPAGEPAP